MGHLPRKERVGCGGGSEVAAEERGGRGESERSQEKGREARASARMRAPGSFGAQAWVSDRAPRADGADVREGGATRPLLAAPGPERPAARTPWWRVITFFSSGGLGSRERKHVSLRCFFRPLPHEKWDGRSWACQGESVPGFPAHFNSVSASTARRFTPPGAPEPSAGTRSASPTRLSPAMQSGSSDLFP